MGDPKQIRRKYDTPKHPWQAERLEKEKEILAEYSLKNKKEIWRMQAFLKKCTNQAKKLANVRTEQAKKEKEQLINRLFKFGLLNKNAEIDDVLSLNVKNILDRRLQTLVYKKNMANTQKQARQFIVHGHVYIGDKKMSVPSYIVPSEDENSIKFKDDSSLIGKYGVKEEEKKGELLGKVHAKENIKSDEKVHAKSEEKTHVKSDEKHHVKKEEKKEEKNTEEKPKVKKPRATKKVEKSEDDK